MNVNWKTAIATLVFFLSSAIVLGVMWLVSEVLAFFGFGGAILVALVASVPLALIADWIIGDLSIRRDRASFAVIWVIVLVILLLLTAGYLVLTNPLAEILPLMLW